jgi:transposase
MAAQSILQFSEKTREELIDEILRLRKENEELQRKLGGKEKADEHRKLLKLLRESQRVENPKTPGRKKGHEGITRVKPEKIDRVVELKLTHCPDCHHPAGASQGVVDHIQEDIIPAHVEVTCFKKHRYWCPCCSKVITAPPAPEEIPNGYVGPNVLVQTVLLKYHHALPFNKIAELFGSLAGLTITEGALAQSLQRMSEWLRVETDVILAAIRASPLIHMDETGWNVGGVRHWLWAAVNKLLAYYRIARSRGAKVPKEILPEKYGGILVTDFYSAYNKLSGRKQRCLVHLEREMRRCFLRDQSEEYVKYHKILKGIVQDARALKGNRKRFSLKVYARKVSLIRKRLLRWACREHENKNLKRLSQRFMKHALEMLTFLEEPEVSADNNLAERMIRPHVIIRNRSFQNRSALGAGAHEVMMSLLHTLRLQDKEPLAFFKKAILRHSQGNPTPILSL